MMLGDAAKKLTITEDIFARREDDGVTTAAIDADADKLKHLQH